MNTTVKVSSRQRLVAERLRRRWTQQEVADQLGTTPGNVSRWERGITSPGPYFRRKLSELFGSSDQELGLTWEESDKFLTHHTQTSALAAFFQRTMSPQSDPSCKGREDLLALLHTLIRPDTTTTLFSVSANSRLGGLNLSEQENGDQERLAQTVKQLLQVSLNLELIPGNAGTVVLVVVNNNICSRLSSLHQREYNRYTICRGDCCDEYPTIETLRQRQGA